MRRGKEVRENNNEELQKIKPKREAKKIYDRTGSEEDRRTNKEAKKESKKSFTNGGTNKGGQTREG